MQKINPVRAGLVRHPDDYLYSSARQWHRRGLVVVDLDKTKWLAA